MPSFGDEALLAVGRWTDDKTPNRPTTMRPQKNGSERHHQYQATELGGRARSDEHGCARSMQSTQFNQLSRAEDLHIDKNARAAIKEVRAIQVIQRQHPACFVNTEAEAEQRGNEADSEPPGSLSRATWNISTCDSAYLPLDEHEVRVREIYWTG
ncbi:hypothetical protein F5Y19DRAFT_295665 [Xylariaceae sp. FL1651]|nr:hypothetical protein F5Y19DRAFT_295665 [Xylariaceae sp. FL1651]